MLLALDAVLNCVGMVQVSCSGFFLILFFRGVENGNVKTSGFCCCRCSRGYGCVELCNYSFRERSQKSVRGEACNVALNLTM